MGIGVGGKTSDRRGAIKRKQCELRTKIDQLMSGDIRERGREGAKF